MDGMEGIEPAARLVDAFGNEVRSLAELLRPEVAETLLGIRHGAGIEPHVDEVRLAEHLPAAVGHEDNIVHVWTVQVDLIVIIKAHVRGIKALVPQRIGFHESSIDRLVYLAVELGDAADALLFLSVFRAPDRERSAPVAAAGEVPVLDVLEPLSETAGTCGFRLPSDGLVERNHLVLDDRGLDEPCVKGIVEHGLVGAPAMGIAVDMLLDLEDAAVFLHHHAEVDVERRSIFGQAVVEGILDVTSCVLGICGIHICSNILGVKVFHPEETALAVNLGLPVAVPVYYHERGDVVVGSHFLIVRSEGRGDVDDAGSFLRRDIVAEDHAERISVRLKPRDQLVVADTEELLAEV